MSGVKYPLKQNQPDSHQSSPWCIIKFFSFVGKDTLYKSGIQVTESNSTNVRQILVISDILRTQTQSVKGSHQSTADAMLASGSLNYQALLSPGDHAMIWMGSDPVRYEKLKTAVKNNDSEFCNNFESGLKFIGRVNSVRSQYNTSAEGKKTLRFLVTFKGFSEFGTSVYYNPLLAPNSPENQQNSELQKLNKIYASISKSWNDHFYSKDKNAANVQSLIDFFIDIFLGVGPRDEARKLLKSVRSPNAAFKIPKELLQILGIQSKNATPNYANMLHTILGIQRYSNNSFMPDTTASISTQRNTTLQLHGTVTSPPDTFNNTPLWSLLQQVSNPSINEIYTTLRVNENNKIMPYFVARQIPFTSIYAPVTGGGCKFIDLPRWVVDPSLQIGSFNIGTSDAARFNFFQIYGNLYGLNSSSPNFSQFAQIAKGNFAIDELDISRNGNRNMIATTLVDFTASAEAKNITVNLFAKLLKDWYGNGHLKLNGSVSLVGIQAPICIGDNLELGGKLFHIEEVSHMYECNSGDGKKTFMTNIGLTQGVLSDGKYAFYEPELREDMRSGLEPGFSDSGLMLGNSDAANNAMEIKNNSEKKRS